MVDAKPGDDKDVAERRGLGPCLDAGKDIGHAQKPEAGGKEKERADEDDDTAN